MVRRFGIVACQVEAALRDLAQKRAPFLITGGALARLRRHPA
jgi:hypothetical protein